MWAKVQLWHEGFGEIPVQSVRDQSLDLAG